jgi:two-component system, OmpR family, phosphate regulon sensor histidine kinase PhoR
VTERELERKARVAELLLEAARDLGESLEPERVYDRFHELLANVVEHDGVVVSSCEAAQDELIRCEYAWSDGKRLDASIFPALPLNRQGGGMQSRVIISGEALLFNDVSDRVRDPRGTYYDVDREGTLRKLPHSGPPGTRAAMMVPVKHEGRVVGVVQVMSNTAEYSTEDLVLVEGLVGQMAAAVRNARLQRERRRLEAAEAAARAVAAEREQAASVLEAVGDGIFLVDGDGFVRLWNRAAALVTGVSPDRARGSAVAAVFPEWNALAARIPVADDGSAARPATVPVEVNGRELWLSFVAVRSADGIVYAFRDLTAERRLEEEKSDFIATVSHELRTPMAAVHGAAQTLLRRAADLTPGQNRELVAMIATQAARLAQISEEVLLATQLDRGKLTVKQESVDVGELARAIVDAMRPQLPNRAVIHVEVASDIGPAMGAPDQIQQVLVNLLDNAAKYAGGPITVRVENADGFVRLSVADSGPGLTLAEQERIFEKFYRAGPQLTRPSGGTGLGLYISRELVQRMGGRLAVRSQPAEGATFVVELPRAAPAGSP